MGRLFSFSSGILLGFAAGIMIDSEKRKKLQILAKTQSEKLKGYENSFKKSIEKIKSIIYEKENATRKK